ncbi:tetratricopeptide repeat protein [Planctomycetota bacterium]
MNRKNLLVIVFTVFLILLSSAGTFIRNRVYKTGLTLWRDCAEKNNWHDMRTMVAYVGALKREGEYEKAAEMLEKARHLEWKKGRFSLENIKFLVSQYIDYYPIDMKIILHEFLLDLDPDDHRSFEFIASAYILKGDMENARIAISLLNRVFVYEGARALMGDIYSHYGSFAMAEREYLKAIGFEPNNPLWRLKLLQNGVRFKSSAEVAAILAENKRYLQSDDVSIFSGYISGGIPQYTNLLLSVAVLSYISGDYKRADQCLTRLIARSEKLPSEQHNIICIRAAGIYSEMKEYKRVYSILDSLDTGTFSEVQELDISLIMGRICRKLGKQKESLEWYDKALQYIDDPEIAYVVKRKKNLAQKDTSYGQQ